MEEASDGSAHQVMMDAAHRMCCWSKNPRPLIISVGEATENGIFTSQKEKKKVVFFFQGESFIQIVFSTNSFSSNA